MRAQPLAVQRLHRAFQAIAATRMRDLPLSNPRLRVETVDFAPHRGPEGEDGLLGALITPWCINLVWLPAAAAQIRPGAVRVHAIAGARYSFIGAHEPSHGLGHFESCSLFSPTLEFADQEAARATARAALRALREVVPARRAFLLGTG
jgi:[NiFe] hydrogenase assembly HybE family chaperone